MGRQVVDGGNVVTRWSAHQRRRGLAYSTIDKRASYLRRWWTFAGDPFDATPERFEEWLDSLELATSNGRYAVISHLHQFYRWALREGLADRDVTEHVDRPRIRSGLPRPIHPTDLDVALMTSSGELRVALLLAATSGLRCCEIARLRWDDVHGARARVLGKGSRERVVPLHRETLLELDQLDRSGLHVLDGWQTAHKGQPGLRVSQRGNRHLHSLGISSTMHTLRHYAATCALSSSGDLRRVQMLLGHASPATTAVYTQVLVDDLVELVESIPIRAA